MKNWMIACIVFLLSGGAWATNPQVAMETSAGTIKLELLPDAAPKTVENFLEYVKSGFYDGTQFHRVIDGFMIQGGGFDEKMQQKQTRPPVVNEGALNQKAGIKNVVGTIAMARTPNPDSATAQFFINVANNPGLDYPSQGGYTVFGKVIEGMDAVNKIAKTPTGAKDIPVTPVMIIKASIVKTEKKKDKEKS
ncbi:MAG: peptidylprolyl isomerase [Burkholderiales bacterium]|jgi:cyclophilin family peptidyl-prolyl cis-trans isomerase|nr:peptidylprolyl isomerase [Burkholderiales bacterium]